VGMVSEALPPGPPQPAATHAASATTASAALRQSARTRPNICVLFDEIDRDDGDTHRQATMHRVAMPVRTRESVAPPSA
jgi:hypothetical protein